MSALTTPSSALTIGSNVVSVGAGYKFMTADERAQFLYAQSYDDNGTTKYRIRYVALNQDGTYSDAIIVTNISSSINSLCIASNHKVYFILSNGEIWVRNSISTNPLDFYLYKDDPNYFIKLGSYGGARGLAPIENRIYFFTKSVIYYIDLSNYGSIAQFKTVNLGGSSYTQGISGLAVNHDYVYVVHDYRTSSSTYPARVVVFAHNGTQIQLFTTDNDVFGTAYGGLLLISDTKAYIKIAMQMGSASYVVPLKNGLLDWSNKSSWSISHSGFQQGREIYDTNLAVYLSGSQANTYTFDSNFSVTQPDTGGGATNGTATPTPAVISEEQLDIIKTEKVNTALYVLYSNLDSLVSLVILIALLNLFKMAGGRRRR
jgi:hypothetical protein